MKTDIHFSEEGVQTGKMGRLAFQSLYGPLTFFPQHVESMARQAWPVKGYYWSNEDILIVYADKGLEFILSVMTPLELTEFKAVYPKSYHVF